MPTDIVGLLILVLTSVVTFTLARVLSRRWRRDRQRKAEEAARAGESRQVRRQRERAKRAA